MQALSFLNVVPSLHRRTSVIAVYTTSHRCRKRACYFHVYINDIGDNNVISKYALSVVCLI